MHTCVVCVCVCVCVCGWVHVLYVCADVCSFALDLGTMLFLNPLCLCVVCVVRMYVCACVCVCVCVALSLLPHHVPWRYFHCLPQTTCITLCPRPHALPSAPDHMHYPLPRACVCAIMQASPPPPPPLTHEEGLLSGCCAWI